MNTRSWGCIASSFSENAYEGFMDEELYEHAFDYRCPSPASISHSTVRLPAQTQIYWITCPSVCGCAKANVGKSLVNCTRGNISNQGMRSKAKPLSQMRLENFHNLSRGELSFVLKNMEIDETVTADTHCSCCSSQETSLGKRRDVYPIVLFIPGKFPEAC